MCVIDSFRYLPLSNGKMRVQADVPAVVIKSPDLQLVPELSLRGIPVIDDHSERPDRDASPYGSKVGVACSVPRGVPVLLIPRL